MPQENAPVPGGLLQGRTALVYGAGGPVGGAVARAFAAEGAEVFLAGRTESRPVIAATRTHFLTTRAAARHMIRQGSGVVLMFGGSGPQTLRGLGGFKIALDAMEGQRRQWALELGKSGIRVVTMVTGGIVETLPWQTEGREEIVEEITRSAHLNRTATLEDVGNVAVFIASDRAGAITDATVNISCGAIVDY